MAELTTPPIKDMSIEPHRCVICGEPMPAGETMFKFHGYSGPCPKPPLPRPRQVMVGYTFRDADDGFWLDVEVDRQPFNSIRFDTAGERDRAHADMLDMMRSVGAQDMPSARPQ